MTVSKAPRTDVDPDAYGPVGRSAWMDVDWREFLRWEVLDQGPVNVVDMPGEREPVVFVHGLSGCWQNWLENLPFFHARGHRVVALDLPGFGQSPMPRDPISISGYGRTVMGVMDALDLPEATLVGNSMGGFTAAECAIQFPDRVAAVVLDAAAIVTIADMRNEHLLRLMRLTEFVLASSTAWVASKSDFVARRPRLRKLTLLEVLRSPEELPAPLIAEQLKGSGKPGFIDALDALTDYPLRDRLSEISCPTLIIHGDRDRLVPVKDAHKLEQLIPGARKLVYAGTGHVPQLERPDRFNRDVAEFVDAT